MIEQRVQRRLAAILAADVVGYSALMQRAEEATYAEFERLKREVIEPSLSRQVRDGFRFAQSILQMRSHRQGSTMILV